MTCFICETCGTQYGDSDQPPSACAVCVDDRQYVARGGQRWTTHDRLAVELDVRIELDDGITGIGVVQPFAIPQRALLVTTEDAGNILWDCISVVTPDAVEQIERLGGIELIAISHPHFYASMIEWSDALGGVPIMVHDHDHAWIHRSSPAVHTWTGDRIDLSPTVTLLHLPGHFPGSAALHWHDTGRSRLLAGDTLHVAADRRHVSVMHSVPNHIPVGPAVIADMQARLDGVDFDDLFGFTWGLNIIGGARAQVDLSLRRYVEAITTLSSRA